MAADLTAFLDYGHWRLVPALLQPGLQAAGLAIYTAVALWKTWTDSYLAKYFSEHRDEFMNSGPYRYPPSALCCRHRRKNGNGVSPGQLPGLARGCWLEHRARASC